jgi:hypothetical protein
MILTRFHPPIWLKVLKTHSLFICKLLKLHIEIRLKGIGLHWPSLNLDLTALGVLASLFDSRQLLRAHAAKVGMVKLISKTRVAKAKVVKGGHPLKTLSIPV